MFCLRSCIFKPAFCIYRLTVLGRIGLHVLLTRLLASNAISYGVRHSSKKPSSAKHFMRNCYNFLLFIVPLV